MSRARFRQRQRILRARTVSERVAHMDHLAANDAQSDAAALADRLANEIARCGLATGATTGQMLAARAALAGRLALAMASMAQRQNALSASATLAASRSLAARQAKRQAELLTERTWTGLQKLADKADGVSSRPRGRRP
jgi:hypothetical protein